MQVNQDSFLNIPAVTGQNICTTSSAGRAVFFGENVKGCRTDILQHVTHIKIQPRTDLTAFAVFSTTSSASAFVRQKGGAKPRISPCGMARAIT